jgi:tetratricopeptide (TPR) repeat protein
MEGICFESEAMAEHRYSLRVLYAYKRAIRIDPDFASAHYNLGVALLRTGDKAAALDEYKILKALDKPSADQLFNQIYY